MVIGSYLLADIKWLISGVYAYIYTYQCAS